MKTLLKVSGRRVLSLRVFGQDSLKSASTPTSKRISPCVLGLMLVLCLCGAVPKANAVIFVNQGYGTCLDASGGYLKTFVDGGTCNATFAQQWNFAGYELQGIRKQQHHWRQLRLGDRRGRQRRAHSSLQ